MVKSFALLEPADGHEEYVVCREPEFLAHPVRSREVRQAIYLLKVDRVGDDAHARCLNVEMPENRRHERLVRGDHAVGGG